MYFSEKILIERLKKRDQSAFEYVFRKYNSMLIAFAMKFLDNHSLAEDVVQDVFFIMWEKEFDIELKPSLSAYLFRMVRNHCLNIIKHAKVEEKHRDNIISKIKERELHYFGNHESIISIVDREEIQEIINATIAALPAQCKTVFTLSRFDDLKNREIADKLNISVKAVEKHITKALKILREALSDHISK